jgi:plastocyanin
MRYRIQAALPAMAMLLLIILAGGCGNAPGGTDKAAAPPTQEKQAMHSPSPRHGAQAEHMPTSAKAVPKPVANQVVIDDFAFNPPTLTVAAGTKVTWVNRDDVPHTATSTAKPRAFHSGTLDTDDKFSHVFTQRGTYEYFCAVHPKMTGKVIVK